MPSPLQRPLGFACWLLVVSVAAAACTDDGNLLGSENGAGSGAGPSMAGQAAGGSGSNHGGMAGTTADAGAVTSGAGESNPGGTTGAAGGAGVAGGEGGAGGAAGGGACVDEACDNGETCVAYRVVGGAIVFPDQNGQCMAGQHVEGSNCQNDFSYTCATLTGCNMPSNTCHCAAGTECASYPACRTPPVGVGLDASAEILCELLAP